MANTWRDVVARIRQTDGFSHFLKTPPFDRLKVAALRGPVIIVNISPHRSDAIIVRYAETPTSVALSERTYAAMQFQTNVLRDVVIRRTKEGKREEVAIRKVLRALWNIIVYPVVEELQKLDVPLQSRIWWCPTGDTWLLPLHAAGPYRSGVKNLPDLYISSYTPNLTTLITARDRATATPGVPKHPKMLIVTQHNVAGEEELEAAGSEMARIREIVSDVTLLEGPTGTRDAVLAGLREHNWVHMICHGRQDPEKPLQSRFSLHDAPLHMVDIMKERLPQAELAVLAACYSAGGDWNTPNEVIHLAAGMQFAGFRSVVGTMWAMTDEDGPIVAEEFYRYMFREKEGGPDCSDAAKGLNLAVEALRRRKIPLERRINFVHYGI